MGRAGIRSRPGKGSTKPANVKLRPAPAPEDRTKARRKPSGREAEFAARNAVSSSSSSDGEETDEEERKARKEAIEAARRAERLWNGSNQTEDEEEDEENGDEDKFGSEMKPLHGMTACISGTLENGYTKENIRSMCIALGATFESVLTTETTFLIADVSETDKYKACVDHGIPVLQSVFIADLHAKWIKGEQKIDIVRLSEELRLPPLQDLTICLTGFSQTTREGHRNLITQTGGAAYSAGLQHHVTHLVVGPLIANREQLMSNPKYAAVGAINSLRDKQQQQLAASTSSNKNAEPVKKKIHVVWGEWLEHSLCAFGRVREERYAVELVSTRDEINAPRVRRSKDIVQRRADEEQEQAAQDKSTRAMSRKKKSGDGERAVVKGKHAAGRRLIKQETAISLADQSVEVEKSASSGGTSGKRPSTTNDADANTDAATQKRRKLVKTTSAPSIMDEMQSSSSSSTAAAARTGKQATKAGDYDAEDEEEEELEQVAIRAKTGRSSSAQPLVGLGNGATAPHPVASLTTGAGKPAVKRLKSTAELELMGVQSLLLPAVTAAIAPVPSTSTGKVGSQTTNKLMSAAGSSEFGTTKLEKPASSSSSSLLKLGKSRMDKFQQKSKEETTALFGKIKMESQAVPLASTSMVASTSLDAKTTKPKNEPLSASASMPILGGLDMQDQDDNGGEDEVHSPIFHGKTFLLLFHDVQSEIEQKARQAIATLAGAIADEDGPNIDYLLCKALAPGPLVDAYPENEPRMVTDVWLEACYWEDALVDMQNEEMPQRFLFRPVRCPPIPGHVTKGMMVTYTGFEEDQHRVGAYLDQLKVPNERVMRNRVTTHLIVPGPHYQNHRLGTAHEWGVKVVYPHYFSELAQEHATSAAKIEYVDEEMQEVPMQVDDDYTEVPRVRPTSAATVRKEQGPLTGCRVHVSHKLQDFKALQDVAKQLGADVVYNLEASTAAGVTHLVCRSQAGTRDNKHTKEAKLLNLAKVKMVHPDWLADCALKAQKMPESMYKHTKSANRSLEVAVQSQGMSRASSSSSGIVSVRGGPSSDDDLPPPLVSRNYESMQPAPSMQGVRQSTPRGPQPPPSSPPRQRSGSAAANGISTPDARGSAPKHDGSDENTIAGPSILAGVVDDSGYAPSGDKRKAMMSLGQILTSSPQPQLAARTADVSELGMLSKQEAEPLLPAVNASTKNLMAEMEALLQVEVTTQQLNARLAYQQISHKDRASRRLPGGRKSDLDSSHVEVVVPSAVGTASSASAAAAHLRRLGVGYQYIESQYGRHGETQDMGDEQTMVIRINDPVAEATKAKLLAGIRSANSAPQLEPGIVVDDDEATQMDTQETSKSTHRTTRSGQTTSARSRS